MRPRFLFLMTLCLIPGRRLCLITAESSFHGTEPERSNAIYLPRACAVSFSIQARKRPTRVLKRSCIYIYSKRSPL